MSYQCLNTVLFPFRSIGEPCPPCERANIQLGNNDDIMTCDTTHASTLARSFSFVRSFRTSRSRLGERWSVMLATAAVTFAAVAAAAAAAAAAVAPVIPDASRTLCDPPGKRDSNGMATAYERTTRHIKETSKRDGGARKHRSRQGGGR